MERLDRLGTRTALAIPTELPDDEVVRRVLGGEPALFEVLMRRYNQRVFRGIRSVLRDDHESERCSRPGSTPTRISASTKGLPRSPPG